MRNQVILGSLSLIRIHVRFRKWNKFGCALHSLQNIGKDQRESYPIKKHPLRPTSGPLETGEIARQASGAVMVSMGDTVVLVSVVGVKKRQAGSGFLPADG